MNDQRKVIYEQRNDIMDAEDVGGHRQRMRAETVVTRSSLSLPAGIPIPNNGT